MSTSTSLASDRGARFVRDSGYDGCVELSNDNSRAVLEPNLGGRVSSYQLKGVESLQRDPSLDGARWGSSAAIRHPPGGRFDIGPEYGGPARDELWLGSWSAEITGPRAARLTSAIANGSGLELVREFALAADSPHLRCTQVIRNRGARPVRTFHWGRTFLVSGGIALAPLANLGRFPCGYALGGPAGIVDFQPQSEPNVRIRDGVLEILGAPLKAKFNFDVDSGWLAYLDRAGLLFLKKFPVYPNRVYGELAANNASIWYGGAKNTPGWPGPEHVVELEPIGPLEILEPGATCSFIEDWWLEPMILPSDGQLDLQSVRAVVAAFNPAASLP